MCINFDKGIGHRIIKLSPDDPDAYRLDEPTMESILKHFEKIHINHFNQIGKTMEDLSEDLKKLSIQELEDYGYFKVENTVIENQK